MKVEGGQVEGGAGSQAGSRPENRASIQAQGRDGHRLDRVGGFGQGRAKPRSGVRTSGFFGAAPARRPDICNTRRGYLGNPVYTPTIGSKNLDYITTCDAMDFDDDYPIECATLLNLCE